MLTQGKVSPYAKQQTVAIPPTTRLDAETISAFRSRIEDRRRDGHRDSKEGEDEAKKGEKSRNRLTRLLTVE